MPIFKKIHASRSKYTTYYNSKITKLVNSSLPKIKAGYICELKYKPINIQESTTKKTILNPVQKYIVLILHSNFHGKIHAIKLTEVRPAYFKKWAEKVGIREDEQTKMLLFKIKFPKLHMSNSFAKKFYNRHVKPFTHSSFEKSYRTFNAKQLVSVKIAQFNYDKL